MASPISRPPATPPLASDPAAPSVIDGSPDGAPPMEGALRNLPFWAVSALLHVILLALLLGIAVRVPEDRRAQAVTIRVLPSPPDVELVEPPATKTRPKLLVERARETPSFEVSPLEVEPALERPLIDAGSPLESLLAAPDPIGLAGQTPGILGDRGHGGRPHGPGGPPPGSDVVLRALRWLARHQSDDGGWRARDFTERCGTPCRDLAGAVPAGGPALQGFPEHDLGVTALAVLAFAGYGVTHQEGWPDEFVPVVRRAVRYLKAAQVRSNDPADNGRFGSGRHEQWTYDHAIATLALAEILLMSRDTIGLERAVTDATRLCLFARNDGYGWKYGIKPGRNDTSVTGWMLLALKIARHADLDIPPSEFDAAFAGGLRWIDRATSRASGKTGYEVPGDEGSRLALWGGERYPFSKDLSCMTAVGVLCRLLAGESRATPAVKKGVDLLVRSPPQWSPGAGGRPSSINFYYWYCGSYALYQFGGSLWEEWAESMLPALRETQRRGGDEDGSWDAAGEWGAAGGRVYATAMGALTLEVYYRYERVK